MQMKGMEEDQFSLNPFQRYINTGTSPISWWFHYKGKEEWEENQSGLWNTGWVKMDWEYCQGLGFALHFLDELLFLVNSRGIILNSPKASLCSTASTGTEIFIQAIMSTNEPQSCKFTAALPKCQNSFQFETQMICYAIKWFLGLFLATIHRFFSVTYHSVISKTHPYHLCNFRVKFTKLELLLPSWLGHSSFTPT